MRATTETQVAEALFVSDLQPSQSPSAGLIRAAVDRMIGMYGPDGCAARMSSEFGDHPDLAVRRMRWVRQLMNAAGIGEILDVYRPYRGN